MTLLIILFLLILIAENQWKPRFEYLKESSVLMLYYSIKNNIRKSIIIKL